MRIVIADDESIIRLDLQEMLSAQGHHVAAACADGASALAAIREHRPDVAVLDVRMPEMEGIEVAEIAIREQLCAIVLLTAFSEEELVQRAVAAGVMAYLVKPFQDSDVLPAIAVAAQRFNELRALREEVADLASALETRKVVERAKGIIMQQTGESEPQAFKRLQRQAMNSRRSLKEVAEAIVTAHQALTD